MRILKKLGPAAVALSLAACVDVPPSTGPATVSSGPSFTISDAINSGGNPHFYLLPPLVPAPSPGGTFDALLSPVVEICEWANGACVAPSLATYTATSGPGSETVRLDAEAEQYVVNWHTDQFDLATDKVYRIGVRAGQTELGFADVQPVGTAKEVKNVQTGEYVALVNGRTMPIKFRIETGVVASVSVAPASATLAAGATQQFVATLTDLHGDVLTGPAVSWESSHKAVATVDASGLVTGVAPGAAIVTATSEGTSGTATITVKAPGYQLIFDGGDPTTGITQVTIQQSDGSGRRILTSYNLGGGGIGSLARWSPDGTKVIYQIATPQHGDLYLVNEDGSGTPLQLTRNASLNAGASFSPDGTKIVFMSTRTGNYELWMMNADGSGQTQLTHTALEDGGGVFSPDGSQIAFLRGDGTGWGRDIWIMSATPNADGTYTERQVTANGGLKSAARWSPDGKLLVVEREEVLYTVDATADRASLAEMTPINTNGLRVAAPDWSPDGQKIVFAAVALWDLYLVNPNGTGLERIPTPDGFQENYASFKP